MVNRLQVILYLIPFISVALLIYYFTLNQVSEDQHETSALIVPPREVVVDIKFNSPEQHEELKSIVGNRFKSREQQHKRTINFDSLPPMKPSHYKPDLSMHTAGGEEDALKALIRYYLAPWTPIKGSKSEARKVTQRMLAAMELSYKGGAVRIRIHNGKLYYRKLVYWRQTYRTQRMAWYLALLRDMLDTGVLSRELKVDFVLYLGDGPKVAADTFTTDAGFPLFSLRTSVVHLDIPVPDSTAFGSNGNYMWPEEARRIPWEERQPKVVFRGRASCLKMQADNWHFCNRIRAAQLSGEEEGTMDLGVIEWNQLFGNGRTLEDAPKPVEVEESTGVKTVSPMDYLEQAKYRFVLDLDGGLGSSRKPGILASGSLLISQDSPWYVHWEPLAAANRHYLAVDRSLHTLPDAAKWAKENPESAQAITQNGQAFAATYTTLASARKYLSLLLQEYAKLLVVEGWEEDQPVTWDYCVRPAVAEVQAGPMGCSRGWLEYNGRLPLSVADDRRGLGMS